LQADAEVSNAHAPARARLLRGCAQHPTVTIVVNEEAFHKEIEWEDSNGLSTSFLKMNA
jgi:hypothetical protein